MTTTNSTSASSAISSIANVIVAASEAAWKEVDAAMAALRAVVVPPAPAPAPGGWVNPPRSAAARRRAAQKEAARAEAAAAVDEARRQLSAAEGRVQAARAVACEATYGAGAARLRWAKAVVNAAEGGPVLKLKDGPYGSSYFGSGGAYGGVDALNARPGGASDNGFISGPDGWVAVDPDRPAIVVATGGDMIGEGREWAEAHLWRPDVRGWQRLPLRSQREAVLLRRRVGGRLWYAQGWGAGDSPQWCNTFKTREAAELYCEEEEVRVPEVGCTVSKNRPLPYRAVASLEYCPPA